MVAALCTVGGSGLVGCQGTSPAPVAASPEAPAPSSAASEAPSAAAAQLLRVSRMSLATHAERDHFLYLPAGHALDPDKRWPVLLFLHGDGSRGDAKGELDYVMRNGPLYEAWIQKRDLPFIIIAPQLPTYGREATVDYLKNRTRADIPLRLEAGVPDRPVEAGLPVWCFAGGRDASVRVKNFYAGLNQLEALGARELRFTIEEDMGHDVWARVYAGRDVYDWLLSHAKAGATPSAALGY